jgi:hypothetical protein
MQIGEIIFVICAKGRVQLSNLFHIPDEMVPLSALHSFCGNYAEAGSAGWPPCACGCDGLLSTGLQTQPKKSDHSF